MRNLILTLAFVLHPARLQADTFLLASGGQLTGDLVNADQNPRKDYLIKLNEGGHVLLDKSLVKEVRVKTDAQIWYETALAKVENTVESHWTMAEACLNRKLNAEREFHLNEILNLEPDHAEARRALGYSRLEGKWQRQEDFMVKRGYVRHENKWKLPQEIELETRGNTVDSKAGEWRKRIKLWRSWIVRGREKAIEGRRLISETNDPFAASVLAELLDEDKEPAPLKLLYIQALQQMRVDESLSVLARRAMGDADPTVREAALAALETMDAREIVPSVVKLLKSAKNFDVQRAAQLLGRLEAAEATLPLIEALTTKHKQQIGTPGQTNAGFDKDGGGGGLSMGGGAKVVELEVQNDRVLAALTHIHSGVNFGYNKDAWRKWYAQQRAPDEFNLRRTK